MRKIIMASITAVVVIAVLAGTLIPVLDDSTSTENTFTNNGLFRVTEYDATASFTAKWDHTTPYQLEINGQTVDLPNTQQTYDMTVIGADSFILRYNAGSNPYVQLYSDSFTGSYVANVNNATDMTITVSAGSVTFDNGAAASKTVTYSDKMYACSNDGDYVMKSATEKAYVLGDSTIFAIGRSYVLSTNFSVVISGTFDSITRTYWPEDSVSSWTFGDLIVNATALGDYVDLYQLSSLTWTANDGSNSANITYSQFIVPYEVTAEKSVHFTDGENAILNAIPVIVIIALLLAVVAIVLRSRMD